MYYHATHCEFDRGKAYAFNEGAFFPLQQKMNLKVVLLEQYVPCQNKRKMVLHHILHEPCFNTSY